MTTAPALPAPTLAQAADYLKRRALRAEEQAQGWCREDIAMALMLVAEVERLKGGE